MELRPPDHQNQTRLLPFQVKVTKIGWKNDISYSRRGLKKGHCLQKTENIGVV